MSAVFTVLLPIFALIAIGACAGRCNWLGAGAADILNRFVVRLALPAELFRAVTELHRDQIAHPRFLLVFAAAMLASCALGFALDWRRPAARTARLSGATMEGLASGYANTAFIGLPLCLGVLGPAGLAPVVLASLLTVCALFALAIALVEYDRRRGVSPWRAAGAAGLALGRNPVVIAPLLGGLFDLAGLPVPAALHPIVVLLGDATSPCALVAMGLFLFDTAGGKVPLGPVLRVVAIKLGVQPALAALLALRLLPLPAPWADAAILLSALPTGTGPFMLSRLYDVEAAIATRAILLSTVLSLFTVSALLLVLR